MRLQSLFLVTVLPLLLLLLLLPQHTLAQQNGLSTITYPDDGINYPGCFSDLAAADRNRDGVIKANEYLGFVQTYSKRICHYTDLLSLQQRSAFNALACRCQTVPGANPNCCLGNNAQISTAGALDAARTQSQLQYLTAVCRITDGTIDDPRGCPPILVDPNQPPPFVFVPAVTAPPPATGGLSKGALAGIIIGALALFLLMLLCCCCVCGGRKKTQDEEEEVKRVEETDVEQAPEVVPVVTERIAEEPVVPVPVIVPAPPVTVDPVEPVLLVVEDEDEEAGRGGMNVDEEIEEEEVRKGRGSANIPPEDVEPNRRIAGAGVIPVAPVVAEKVVLRPIELEEEENPDWDYPGQAVNYPTEKDEMSAGEVEHYVPDGGVHLPERPVHEPLDWRKEWQRPEVEDPDDYDSRKHRIQAGLGEGEVWEQLNQSDEPEQQRQDNGDVFDWVVQSALGVLSESEKAGHLGNDNNKNGPAGAGLS